MAIGPRRGGSYYFHDVCLLSLPVYTDVTPFRNCDCDCGTVTDSVSDSALLWLALPDLAGVQYSWKCGVLLFIPCVHMRRSDISNAAYVCMIGRFEPNHHSNFQTYFSHRAAILMAYGISRYVRTYVYKPFKLPPNGWFNATCPNRWCLCLAFAF